MPPISVSEQSLEVSHFSSPASAATVFLENFADDEKIESLCYASLLLSRISRSLFLWSSTDQVFLSHHDGVR